MRKGVKVQYRGLELSVFGIYEKPEEDTGLSGSLELMEIWWNGCDVMELMNELTNVIEIEELVFEKLEL